MSMQMGRPGRGRPPTKNPEQIIAYYGGEKNVPAGVLDRARELSRGIPASRNVSRSVVPQSVPVVESNESDSDILKRIDMRFKLVQDFTSAALDGDVTSMLVSGAPGIGKSHNIKRILNAANDLKPGRVEIVSGGKITPINLYKALWRNQNEGQVLLLDDADAVWYDEDALGVMKGAMDSVKDRQVSWFSQSSALTAEDGTKIDTTHIFRGAIIFISNIDFQTFCDTSSSKIVEHMRAVMNRTQYIDLKLHTQRELALWIDHIVTTTHMLRAAGLNAHQQREVLDYIKANRDALRDLSLRTAMKCVPYVKQYGNDWRDVANMILLR